uniref:Uncharacterized protein n=1 Tax=Oryza punctata TaxID=4537 RepID=A0A0E0LU98_ORYPU
MAEDITVATSRVCSHPSAADASNLIFIDDGNDYLPHLLELRSSLSSTGSGAFGGFLPNGCALIPFHGIGDYDSGVCVVDCSWVVCKSGVEGIFGYGMTESSRGIGRHGSDVQCYLDS